MYLVRISFKNRYGNRFHWDFSVNTNDHTHRPSEKPYSRSRLI
jgi:hypothetical protein